MEAGPCLEKPMGTQYSSWTSQCNEARQSSKGTGQMSSWMRLSVMCMKEPAGLRVGITLHFVFLSCCLHYHCPNHSTSILYHRVHFRFLFFPDYIPFGDSPGIPRVSKGDDWNPSWRLEYLKKKDPDRRRYQRNRTRTVTWQTFIVFTIKSSPSSLQQTHPTLPNSLDARVQTGITMQIPYVPRRQPTSKLRLDARKCAPDCRLGVESDWSRTALSFCLTLEDFALSSWTFEHTVTSSAAELESIIWATPFLMIDINANLTDKFPYLWVQEIFVSHHCTVLSKLSFASQVTDKDSVYSLLLYFLKFNLTDTRLPALSKTTQTCSSGIRKQARLAWFLDDDDTIAPTHTYKQPISSDANPNLTLRYTCTSQQWLNSNILPKNLNP